jgi:hypothetical protein
MTTVVEDLSWDTFLQREVASRGLPESMENGIRQRLDQYRIYEWQAILRQIDEDHPAEAVEIGGDEPHWTEPGQAVFWQEQKVSVRVEDDDGNVKLEQQNKGWEPVGPIPATTACDRHAKGRMAFRNWKAYIQHCTRYNEAPIETLPPEVVERSRHFHWYCFVHDRGFGKGQKKQALQHFRKEKVVTQTHPTLDEMLVQPPQEGRDADQGTDEGSTAGA